MDGRSFREKAAYFSWVIRGFSCSSFKFCFSASSFNAVANWRLMASSTITSGNWAVAMAPSARLMALASRLSFSSFILVSYSLVRCFNRSSYLLKSLMSMANVSSRGGSTFSLWPFTVNTNTIVLPAMSWAGYSTGKVTIISLVSPFFIPTMPSANPSTYFLLCSSTLKSLVSCASSSIRTPSAPIWIPLKSTSTTSPICTGRSTSRSRVSATLY
mmetsp:Transcript_30894/g.49986  ORF Transcript_30894/g.49986 Transcript_30894/m.49986 type:complete len:215 (-) Transcript_30894:866-1510(-)